MSSWQKAVQWGFVALFTLVPLIWLPNTSELFEFNKLILTYILTTLIVGAWAIRCIVEKKFIFRRTLLDLPIFLFLISNLLSLIFSIDIHTSWYGYYSRWNGGLLSLISYALLYWAFVSNMDRKSSLLAICSSLIAAVIISIYGALEHFGFSPSCLLTLGSLGVDCWVQDVQTRIFATLGQPNWMAAYLVALIFIPLSKLLAKTQFTSLKSQSSPKFQASSSNWNLKNWGLENSLGFGIWDLGFFVLLFTALLFTKSRSGLLAFGVSAVVFWILAFNHSKKEYPFKAKRILLTRVAPWILTVIVLTALIPNPVRDLITRTQNLAPKTSPGTQLEIGGTESGNIRKIVWTGAIRIWTGNIKNFLVGTGPETFAMAYYQYRPPEHNQTSEWELLYNKAHNEFLNYLATIGLLGLGSYLVLLGVMSRFFVKTIYDHRITMNDNRITTALFAGWVSIPITNFWGFSVVIVQVLIFLLPAMAVALAQPEAKPTKITALSGGQIFAILVCGSTAVWLIYATARYWWADVKYSSGLNAVKSFQVTSQAQYLLSAYQQYTSAFTLNPAEPVISSELSVAAAYLANSLLQSDATSASQLAQIAVAASDKAIRTSPHHPNYYKSRARTMILLSDIDQRYQALAAEALAKAAEISPTDPRIPYNLGIIYKYLNATPSSILNFQESLRLKPDFADAAQQLNELSRSSASSSPQGP